jgi:hypothetical protein
VESGISGQVGVLRGDIGIEPADGPYAIVLARSAKHGDTKRSKSDNVVA